MYQISNSWKLQSWKLHPRQSNETVCGFGGIWRSQSEILAGFPSWMCIFAVLCSMTILSGQQRSDHRAFLLQELRSGQKGKVSSCWRFVWPRVQTHWCNFLAQFSFWVSDSYMPILTTFLHKQQTHWLILLRYKDKTFGNGSPYHT